MLSIWDTLKELILLLVLLPHATPSLLLLLQYYLTVKGKDVLTQVRSWANLTNIMVTERRETRKNACLFTNSQTVKSAPTSITSQMDEENVVLSTQWANSQAEEKEILTHPL